MELLVRGALADSLSKADGVCRCDRCRLDMMAHALNNLPPRYIVSTRGNTRAYLDSLQGQNQVDVLLAVNNAIQAIGQRPRHEQDRDNGGNALLVE